MGRLAALRHGATGLFARERRETLAGIMDQVAVSLGNLGVGLLVLRISSKEEYGLYGLCYMTIILLNGFSNSVFGQQMTVSYHQRATSDRERFASSMLCGQLVLTIGLGVCVAGLVSFAPDGVLSRSGRILVCITALACPITMAHDLFRTYFFMVHRAHIAFVLDSMLVVIWGGATAFLALDNLMAPHLAAIVALGVSAAVTSCCGLAFSGLSLRNRQRGVTATLHEAWEHGRWALGGAGVTAVQNQAHVYVLGWLGTATAVADLNAARMLLTPMSVLLMGSYRTLVPQMASLMAEGRVREMQRRSTRQLLGLLAVIACYSVAILFGRDAIVGGLLQKSYAGIGPLVLLWAVVLMLQAVDNNLSAMLQVTKRFRFLAMTNVWTAIPVVIVVVPMILLFGAEGSLLTLIGGYTGMMLLLWRDFRRVMREQYVTP